ncbi:hypothetical protein ACFLQY_01570 [Verrucomicrobiota bacterium]
MKMITMLLIVAIISLGLSACEKSAEHPAEHPTQEQVEKAVQEHPTTEHPTP